MSRPPRIQGFNYKGPYRYFITFCTHLRRQIFLNDGVAIETLAQFRITAAEDHFAILAYCLMPDHVHLLLEGLTAQSELIRFVRIGKQRTAYLYSKQRAEVAYGRKGFMIDHYVATTTSKRRRDMYRESSSRGIGSQSL